MARGRVAREGKVRWRVRWREGGEVKAPEGPLARWDALTEDRPVKGIDALLPFPHTCLTHRSMAPKHRGTGTEAQR